DHTTPIVFQYALRAGLTEQPLVIGQFNTFLPLLINAGEPNDMGGYFARRIVAPVLLASVDPTNTQRQSVPGHGRLNLPAQINKLAPGIITEPLTQIAFGQIKH